MIYRLKNERFEIKVKDEAGELHKERKAFYFYECTISFSNHIDIIRFINFVGRISIGLDSITMLEAELKNYYKFPERPESPELLKD